MSAKNGLFLSAAVFVFTMGACSSAQSKKNSVPQIAYARISPDFSADSAYAFVEKQTGFGARVPNTAAHVACGDYLADKLRSFGADVMEQHADITHYTGENIRIRNIIGTYFPEKEKRILLFAHWDSRPFADEEKDAQKQQQPILGADDGASGVGVLLEIARQLQKQPTDAGVDIVFFDLEDWGQPISAPYVAGDWWCVGSRYWAENPHTPDYKAHFGILLDMVGAGGATFRKEGHSLQYAPDVVQRIWNTAAQLGYGNYFVTQKGSYITDDHLPVNELGRARSANIINLKTNTPTGFAPHWHTLADDMRNIDRNTLKAVGQTVLEVVYTVR